MIERPYGLVLNGVLQLGLELIVDDSRIVEIRPHTGLPEPYIISPSFVNAHSHLEYRGLQGKISGESYSAWIREITEAKKRQTEEDIRQDCFLAARENRAAGIARIGEHSDRPYAGEALASVGIDGVLFQELITFFEKEDPIEKIRKVEEKLRAQAAVFPGNTGLAPHAAYTVDEKTLQWLGNRQGYESAETGSAPYSLSSSPRPSHRIPYPLPADMPLSIHVAESVGENAFFKEGEGPIAEFYRSNGFAMPITGKSVVQSLAEWGLARKGVQFVHCCDVDDEDLETMASAGVAVAHCPRSNLRLKCPSAPIREMLDARIPVGLGMDSPASSGPIDMFAEMRAALSVSSDRGKPLTPEEVWRMATTMGAASLPMDSEVWDIYPGSTVPLIKINVENAHSIEDVIESGAPEMVAARGINFRGLNRDIVSEWL